jgi:ABC-2 type transport system ATP-binding protein
VIADDIVVIGSGRIVAQGTKSELLHAAGTLVRSPASAQLASALQRRGIGTARTADGGLHVESDSQVVGEVALAASVPLVELRPAEKAGLEEMFLRLTAREARSTNHHDKPRKKAAA